MITAHNVLSAGSRGKEDILGTPEEKFTILYGRLSNEDSRHGRSISIENQEKILRARAAELNLSNVIFLFDDGITGTMDKRPDFQHAMKLILEGHVAVFMVTDLSRLFRNQSAANDLIEVMLPALGVRFISISENYDSDTNTPADEDLAMFLNLFNEFYPRLTSRKVNAVIQLKAESGERIATRPPYGYMKDPNDKSKIVPDPEAVEIVQHMFELCASGLGPAQIAKRLQKEQVLVPAEYAYRKFGRDHSSRNPERPYEWSDGTVSRILECEDYIGTQVSCKTHKVSYKSDQVVSVSAEKQYRVENAHEPIISRELWDTVRKIRAHKRRPTKMGEMDILSGMVYCAGCGHTHYLCRCGNWEESKHTYVCGTYHSHKTECTPHTIKALHLRQLVLAAIQMICALAKEDRETFVSYILAKQSAQVKKEMAAIRKELDTANKRLTELDKLFISTFEKLSNNVITDEQFTQLNNHYTSEQTVLKETIPVLEAELSKMHEDVGNTEKFLAVVDRYLDIQELTPDILHEFVDRIVVHERSERYKKKNYTQDVDIYFNYIGKFALK